MAYTYPIDPKAMFEDRFEQFVTLGVPRNEVAQMQAAIADMWADAPGGWPFEWSRLAKRYADAGKSYMASLVYGCAKFPCLADARRRKALADQLEYYLKAAAGFPVKFERRMIAVPFRGTSVTIPVHLYSTTQAYDGVPVLLFCGGVDTWKMDMHPLCVAFAQRHDLTVIAFDQPGTGENPAPLIVEADEAVLGLVKEARKIGNGSIAHIGISFGGNYSAMTGLLGEVDASIVLGGPVDKSFEREVLDKLPYGMPGIIGNDIGFAHEPSAAEFATETAKLSRRKLLDRSDNAPMLVINGADDYFIPQADTLVFRGRPKTEVHLLAGTGHCAFSKLPEVMSLVMSWLPNQIDGGAARR